MKRSPLKTKPKEKPDWLGLYHSNVGKSPPLTEEKKQLLQERLRRQKNAKAARFAEQYHSDEFVRWIHQQECCTPSLVKQCNYWPTWQSVASHLAKDKGAGGTWEDVAPQCTGCHTELHAKGPITFCQARGWPLDRLSELAAGYAAEWEALPTSRL